MENEEKDYSEMQNWIVARLIDEKIKKAIMPDYQDRTTDQEGFGLIASNYFKWDGVAIMEAFAEALEDSNFHGECSQVREMIKKYEVGEC